MEGIYGTLDKIKFLLTVGLLNSKDIIGIDIHCMSAMSDAVKLHIDQLALFDDLRKRLGIKRTLNRLMNFGQHTFKHRISFVYENIEVFTLLS